jgi:hypothetical protein
LIVSEKWFQVQDAETGTALGPARELLSEATADKRKLVEPGRAKIGRVEAKSGRGSMSTAAQRIHGRIPAQPQALRLR